MRRILLLLLLLAAAVLGILWLSGIVAAPWDAALRQRGPAVPDLLAAVRADDAAAVAAALEAGAVPGVFTEDGSSALHVAAAEGAGTETVFLLLGAGADLEA